VNDWDTIKKECPRLYKNGIAFCCGPGWYDLIRDLSNDIEKILVENDIAYMHLVQVKEKYGTLRIYMSTETEEISELIEAAEERSYSTCELCGFPGTIRGISTHWLQTQCDKCYLKSTNPNVNRGIS